MAGFSNVTGALDALASSVESTAARLEASSTSIGSTLTRLDESAGALSKTTGKLKKEGSRLDDFIFFLEEKASKGDDLAQLLLGTINQVLEGTLRASDAIHAYGTIMVEINGQTQTLAGLLLDLLPTTGQVQAALSDLRDAELSASELIAQLSRQHNAFAVQFAEMARAWQQGKFSLSQLLKTGREIQRLLPGSETDVLIDELIDAVQSGGLG